jgi:hypothetical protein
MIPDTLLWFLITCFDLFVEFIIRRESNFNNTVIIHIIFLKRKKVEVCGKTYIKVSAFNWIL